MNALVQLGRFGRFSVLGFSFVLPLAGAASVSAHPTASQLLGLLAVAFAFHVFGYVSNDVFDLEVDRTESLRAGSPLVRGLVSTRVAFAVAMIPVPLAATLHLALGGAPAAAIVLMLGMGFGLVYNAYGKRIPIAFVSDAVQALAWIALAAYGALTMRAPLTIAFAWLAITTFLYVLMVNGLHGGLRDIANDARHGAKTTAILLGAYADQTGRLIVPSIVKTYGLTLHLLLLVCGVLTVLQRWPVAAIAIAIAHVLLLRLARTALNATEDRIAMVRAGIAHLFLSLAVVFLPFALFADRMTAATMIAANAAPALVLFVRMARFLALAATSPREERE